MLAPTVLIVEDDHELRDLIVRSLSHSGFEARGVGTGAELLDAATGDAVDPDLLVVDIGLPDADGRDLCQGLRARGVSAPVLFLTARDALPDRLSGFAAGSPDSVTKPCVFAEVVARLQALARRAGADGAVEAAGLRLDPVTHS